MSEIEDVKVIKFTIKMMKRKLQSDKSAVMQAIRRSRAELKTHYAPKQRKSWEYQKQAADLRADAFALKMWVITMENIIDKEKQKLL